jgi:hypothetical protein
MGNIMPEEGDCSITDATEKKREKYRIQLSKEDY